MRKETVKMKIHNNENSSPLRIIYLILFMFSIVSFVVITINRVFAVIEHNEKWKDYNDCGVVYFYIFIKLTYTFTL